MTMYVESIRNFPYMRKTDISKEFSISMSTVKSRINEIEKEIRAIDCMAHHVQSK